MHLILSVTLGSQHTPPESSGVGGSGFGLHRVQVGLGPLLPSTVPLPSAVWGLPASPSGRKRHANDLSSSVYCLSFSTGMRGDRFTKYIVQSYYGV